MYTCATAAENHPIRVRVCAISMSTYPTFVICDTSSIIKVPMQPIVIALKKSPFCGASVPRFGTKCPCLEKEKKGKMKKN